MGFAFDKPLVWIIILVIVLLIFGAGKLPEIGRSLGRSIKEFKDETTNGLNGTPSTVPPATTDEIVNRTDNAPVAAGAKPAVRRRIIKHPDGREEIIEEQI